MEIKGREGRKEGREGRKGRKKGRREETIRMTLVPHRLMCRETKSTYRILTTTPQLSLPLSASFIMFILLIILMTFDLVSSVSVICFCFPHTWVLYQCYYSPPHFVVVYHLVFDKGEMCGGTGVEGRGGEVKDMRGGGMRRRGQLTSVQIGFVGRGAGSGDVEKCCAVWGRGDSGGETKGCGSGSEEGSCEGGHC